MEVSVDRISSSGNPIAEEKHKDKIIHVPEGEVGETYEIELVDFSMSYYVGLHEDVSQIERRRIKTRHTGKKKVGVPKSDADPKSSANQKSDTSIKYGGFSKNKNKNELLNGKL